MEVDAVTRIYVQPLNHLILEPGQLSMSGCIVQEVHSEFYYTLMDCW